MTLRLTILFLLFSLTGLQAATTINFTLDEPCKTSCGIYTNSIQPQLIRTLWSNVRMLAAGSYSSNWDGNDDNGAACPAGTYSVKVLQHNVNYVWDGALGNSSDSLSGPSVHRGFYTMHSMAIWANIAFYVQGYNEGQYGFHTFLTSAPNTQTNQWVWGWNSGSFSGGPGVARRNWNFATTDGTNVYFGSGQSAGTGYYSGPGFFVACQVTNQTMTTFSSGVVVSNDVNSYFTNGIIIGTQPSLTGLAVQPSQALIAGSVSADGKVYLYDKLTGAANSPASFTVTTPTGLAFDTNNTLWVISGTSLLHYGSINGTPTLLATLTGFSNPLAVAVSPLNTNIILVSDGGSRQQVVAVNAAGTVLWTNGILGGYATSPNVSTNTFQFVFDGEFTAGTFICVVPDGSYWLGDGGDHRNLHFDSTGTNYLEQIAWNPHGYCCAVDPNNPSRVFNQFLEYVVDYSKPLQAATLVKNWGGNISTNYNDSTYVQGLYDVTTLSNGRTYAQVQNFTNSHANSHNVFDIVELTSTGVRATGVEPNGTSNDNDTTLDSSGNLLVVTRGTAIWYKYPLTGFDGSNNPIYGSIVTNGTAFWVGITNPVPRSGSAFGPGQTTVTTNSVIISLDTSTTGTQFHLGGVPVAGTNWLWQANTVGTLNNDGHFETGGGLTYPASGLRSVDNQIVYGFHGEFFRGQAEAAQYFHYLDDGLFVNQFGESNINHDPKEGAIPGYAGNNICLAMVKTNGSYFICASDESGHGMQRWQMVNAQNIREQTGTVALNGSVTLTPPTVSWPTVVTGSASNACAQLAWTPVAGAASYDVRQSTNNGGSYVTLSGNTTATNLIVSGLANGTPYYFIVAPVISGSESTFSEQVALTPFDTTKYVSAAGRLDEFMDANLPVYLTATNLTAGLPSMLSMYRYVANREIQEINNFAAGSLSTPFLGRHGYQIYDFNGAGVNSTNLSAGYSATNNSGWTDLTFNYRYASIDGVSSNNPATMFQANPTGVIGIQLPEGTNYHYLTILCPPKFNNARTFTATLASTNGDSAAYTVNDAAVGGGHFLQWLFKGNVTLTLANTSGNQPTLQDVLLDDQPLFVGINSGPAPTLTGNVLIFGWKNSLP